MLPDHWNPRLWLRDWLLKPSGAESSCGKQMPGRETIDATTFGAMNLSAQGDPAALAAFHRTSDGSVSVSPAARPSASEKGYSSSPPAPNGSAERPDPDLDPRST